MDRDKIIILAKKLLALKEGWEGWEATNAWYQLEKLLEKYWITMNEVCITYRTERRIPTPRYTGKRDLIFQVICMCLTDDVPISYNYWKTFWFVDMTDQEFADFEYKLPIFLRDFSKHMAKQKKVAYRAFLQHNDIFYKWPRKERSENDQKKKMTAEEYEIIMEAMRQNVDKSRVDIALNSWS